MERNQSSDIDSNGTAVMDKCKSPDYPESGRTAFAVIITLTMVAVCIATVKIAIRALRTIRERRKRVKSKRDSMNFTLACMFMSSVFAAADAGMLALVFGSCKIVDPDIWDVLQLIDDYLIMIARSFVYLGIVVGLIFLACAWRELVLSTRSLGRATQGDNTRMRVVAAVLALLYFSHIIVNFILYGIDGKKYGNAIVFISATTVMFYLIGIAIFAIVWGRNLSRMIIVVASSASKGSSSNSSYNNTLKSIRLMTWQMAKLTIGYLFGILAFGGGSAAKNPWVMQMSIAVAYSAQYKVVEVACRGASLGVKKSNKKTSRRLSFGRKLSSRRSSSQASTYGSGPGSSVVPVDSSTTSSDPSTTSDDRGDSKITPSSTSTDSA